MRQVIPRTRTFLVFAFSFLVSLSTTTFAQSTQQDDIVSTILANDHKWNSFKASAQIGIPHPTAPLVQWVDALIAYQKDPEYLYIKGFKPLVPVYFVLTSDGKNFSLFFTREQTLYQGENSVFETDPDLELKLIPRDFMKGLGALPFDIQSADEWKPHELGHQLIVRNSEGLPRADLTIDEKRYPWFLRTYTKAGFPALEVSKSDWQNVAGIEFPFEVKMKRLLPRKNDLIIRFKEIRPNATLEAEILNYEFPENVKIQAIKTQAEST